MRPKLIFFLSLYLMSRIALAQSPLEIYIQEGLENNLGLKQQETNYQKSLEALKESKGLFFPNISLEARYSVSQGGRTIDLPIGDLLNPVYATLNQLIQQNSFPPVENLSFMFLRPQEHETKLRLVQPVFNTDIYYNSLIKRELVRSEQITLLQYKHELIAEIKKAWYQTAMAKSITEMLGKSRILLEENVRINQKLFENDKITKDILYRSETEIIKFDQQIQEAEKNYKLAGAYLNFLVNRPLDEVLQIDRPGTLPLVPESAQSYAQSALNNREELKKIDSYEQLVDYQLKMQRAGALPELMLVADYGFQGEKYALNKDSDFAQASALLSWNLFRGFQNRSKIQQILLQKEMIEHQKEEVKKQIKLQVTSALLELETSGSALSSAEAQKKSAEEGFRLVKRKYEEGLASLLAFIDARTSLTQAEENLIISRYRYLSDYAEFEKATAINTI
ncbi:MAG: TolC family protein [Bacteroidetes bacterium]|nr:TolC family protein [Bacteroidota bacterium]MBT5426520.1 TolC family protein [Bacteroidota bacterium]MBT7094453.1 TolC family protein [Bacteroidota bacterium]MBT7466485.1 TolC family protein [Bacteroidota bacterium]